MRILQAGVPKSGNFWLYRLLRSITRESGMEHRSFIQEHPIYEIARELELGFAGQADVDCLNIEPEACYCRINGGAVFYERIGDIDEYVSRCSHVWTHSPICQRSFDVLRKFDKVIYIIRDPRDVAVSMSQWVFTPYFVKYYPPHYEKRPTSYLKHKHEEKRYRR